MDEFERMLEYARNQAMELFQRDGMLTDREIIQVTKDVQENEPEFFEVLGKLKDEDRLIVETHIIQLSLLEGEKKRYLFRKGLEMGYRIAADLPELLRGKSEDV